MCLILVCIHIIIIQALNCISCHISSSNKEDKSAYQLNVWLILLWSFVMKVGDVPCKLCLATGTSLRDWSTGTSAIYMTSATDTTTTTLGEMTTTTSLMNSKKSMLMLPWNITRFVHIMLCGSFKLSSTVKILGCGGILTGDQGLFASPNYPSYYSNSLDCEWVIRCLF